MKLHASGEDYLEAVLMVQKKKGMVRFVDLARHMGYSKPSISHAVSILRDDGFLMMDKGGFLHLNGLVSSGCFCISRPLTSAPVPLAPLSFSPSKN